MNDKNIELCEALDNLVDVNNKIDVRSVKYILNQKDIIINQLNEQVKVLSGHLVLLKQRKASSNVRQDAKSAKDTNIVYATKEIFENTDEASTEVTSGDTSKDVNKVYATKEIVENTDGPSTEVTSDDTSVDCNVNETHNKDEKNYECDCGKKFNNNTTFQAHKKTHEKKKCITCNKMFTHKIYRSHKYIHDPEFWDRFKCKICQRPMRNARALENHMQLHTGAKSHMCDLCGRTYNRYENMVKHRRLHKPDNLWKHNCTHCEEKFEYLTDLVSHTEHVHSIGVEKPSRWICRICGKHVSSKLALQDHERTHTGAKPYICEWCGRGFRTQTNLLQHHFTHTGDRKHECEVCGKKFARKSFIALHMRVHTGEQPFQCDICNRRFKQAGDMRRHRSRHVQQKEQNA